jgi:hypothetical protein
MHNEIELNYLRERNKVLLGRVEEYMMEIRDLRIAVRELEITLSRMNHPSFKDEND